MLTLLGGIATPASADWLLTPYLGVTFGTAADFGDAIGDFDDVFEKKLTYGVTTTWMGAGIVGFEFDFAHTPEFFDTPAIAIDLTDSHVTTFMGNLVVGAPIGGTQGPGVRPYGSIGMGLLRTNVAFGGLFDDLDANELGMNVGGGVYVFFTDGVGLRGDLRYFRGLRGEDEGDGDPFELDLAEFEYWRATVGVTFRFGG
jgi:hypothetical protein